MSFASAEQFDLITDDPRAESPACDLREFWRASKELGGLLTQSQAARILDVPTGQIGMWIRRGRMSTREVAGVRMVGGREVTALLLERQKGIKAVGGRGLKAPSLSELAAAAWEDMGMDE